MRVGTKSVLFGAHQFLIHPFILAIAWWRLYGFPWDIRLWVAFFVHDLGYIGKPNMDGPEGESHPELGANIMHFLFDWSWETWKFRTDDPEEAEQAYSQGYHPVSDDFDGKYYFRGIMRRRTRYWKKFCLYHSRFYAKKAGAQPSDLCLADKLAIVVMPTWLWVMLCRMSGELAEYLHVHHRGDKYNTSNCYDEDPYRFYENIKAYLRKWIEAQQKGEPEPVWPPGA